MDFAAVRGLLLLPGEFYRQKAEHEPRLAGAVLVVFLLGILGALAAVSSADATAALMPPEYGDYSLYIVIIGVVAALAGSFVVWLVWAVVLHLISMAFGGRGTFVRTMEFVGWGMTPQLIGSLITLPISFIYYSGLDLQPVSDVTLIQQLAIELAGAPMVQLIQVIGLLFLVWTANLWIFGLQQAHGLPSRKAILMVAIPVGLYLAYTIFSFMG